MKQKFLGHYVAPHLPLSLFLFIAHFIGLLHIYLHLYCFAIRAKRRKRRRGEGSGQTPMITRHLTRVILETCLFMYCAPTLPPNCLLHAHSVSGFRFDTNSCYLVQDSSEGRMMCIIRKAKNSGERRCFKVPEFDSSERLLVCVVAGGHLFCARQKQDRMLRNGK